MLKCRTVVIKEPCRRVPGAVSSWSRDRTVVPQQRQGDCGRWPCVLYLAADVSVVRGSGLKGELGVVTTRCGPRHHRPPAAAAGRGSAPCPLFSFTLTPPSATPPTPSPSSLSLFHVSRLCLSLCSSPSPFLFLPDTPLSHSEHLQQEGSGRHFLPDQPQSSSFPSAPHLNHSDAHPG